MKLIPELRALGSRESGVGSNTRTLLHPTAPRPTFFKTRRLDHSPRDRFSRRFIKTPWSMRNGMVSTATGLRGGASGIYTNPAGALDCGCGNCVCGCRGAVGFVVGDSGYFGAGSTLKATVAGVTTGSGICIGCLGAGSTKFDAFNVNGTYCLTALRPGVNCELTFAAGDGAVTGTGWLVNNLCDPGAPNNPLTGTWGLTVFVLGGGIVAVTIGISMAGIGPAGIAVFNGSAPWDCVNGVTVANSLVGSCTPDCGATIPGNSGYGGTVTLIPAAC